MPASPDDLPPVPLTVEGACVFHQMFRVRWSAWKALSSFDRAEVSQEAAALVDRMELNHTGQSAVFSLVGHKGDLILVHFRRSFDELNQAELDLARTRLADYLEPTASYLSVVELGLYESSAKTYATLAERGIQPHTGEWKAGIQEVPDRQREAMHPPLYPEMPPHRCLRFYPVD